MAESMVEELLKRSDNKVYRFGYEAILQNLTQIKKSFDIYSDTGERIRTIPDFIIIDDKGGSFFLEVKFRWDGKLHDKDIERLKKINKFWSAKLIIVNSSQKPYFNISEPPYFDKKDKFIVKPLCEETSWKIDPSVYDEMEVLVKKYLNPTLF